MKRRRNAMDNKTRVIESFKMLQNGSTIQKTHDTYGIDKKSLAGWKRRMKNTKDLRFKDGHEGLKYGNV
jgi:hypothetical protein